MKVFTTILLGVGVLFLACKLFSVLPVSIISNSSMETFSDFYEFEGKHCTSQPWLLNQSAADWVRHQDQQLKCLIIGAAKNGHFDFSISIPRREERRYEDKYLKLLFDSTYEYLNKRYDLQVGRMEPSNNRLPISWDYEYLKPNEYEQKFRQIRSIWSQDMQN